jgi:hypothetical protein
VQSPYILFFMRFAEKTADFAAEPEFGPQLTAKTSQRGRSGALKMLEESAYTASDRPLFLFQIVVWFQKSA